MPNRIRDLREAQGLSRAEVAVACRVTEHAVYKWERGLRVPRPEQIESLTKLFGVGAAHLMGDSDDDNGGERAAA